ncbi:hypothetical protein [Segetibacter koreensis]|uniref:hypothetical protein n=1 Tax=Segetibacter koreensis TaxID=398037 RepID=UPI0003792A34|nr:hypothetical protein [Segetibacter koreensis]
MKEDVNIQFFSTAANHDKTKHEFVPCVFDGIQIPSSCKLMMIENKKVDINEMKDKSWLIINKNFIGWSKKD